MNHSVVAAAVEQNHLGIPTSADTTRIKDSADDGSPPLLDASDSSVIADLVQTLESNNRAPPLYHWPTSVWLGILP